MSITRWLTMRQAQDALRSGQLDAAGHLVAPYLRSGHRTALEFARALSQAYHQRAEKSLRRDDAESAWKDLLAAEALPHHDARIDSLRLTLTKLGVAECRAALAAGKPGFVLEQLAALKHRRAFHPEFDPLELAARNALSAQEQADRGEFDAAIEGAPNRQWKEEYSRRAREVQMALPMFAECLADGRWPEALQHAATILNAAPNHREARLGKAKAWENLEPSNSNVGNTQPTIRAGSARDGMLAPPLTLAARTLETPGLPRRFLLWIDGVGGYLVCTGSRVAFGQAANRGPVDVPLFADVSRLHAEIHRDGEGYTLESGQNVLINGTPAQRKALQPEDRITFGSTCQLLFQQPMPISPTAKLELVSGHRLPVAVDAIWLMAENLVLGPSAPAHIVVPELPGPVVFYRSKEGLGFRCAGRFRIDGEPGEDRAILRVPCHVGTDHLSFALEAVSAKS